tara:strand:- start:199 stop:516 length:318 start_codon:yes stop_codon:yes gene_type:complete
MNKMEVLEALTVQELDKTEKYDGDVVGTPTGFYFDEKDRDLYFILDRMVFCYYEKPKAPGFDNAKTDQYVRDCSQIVVKGKKNINSEGVFLVEGFRIRDNRVLDE